jgi:hypothetical protein
MGRAHPDRRPRAHSDSTVHPARHFYLPEYAGVSRETEPGPDGWRGDGCVYFERPTRSPQRTPKNLCTDTHRVGLLGPAMVNEMPVRPDPSGTRALPVSHPMGERQAGDKKRIAALCPPPSCVLGRAAYNRCFMDARRARQGKHTTATLARPPSRSHRIHRSNEATPRTALGTAFTGVHPPSRPGSEEPLSRDESFSDGRLRAVGHPSLFHVKQDSSLWSNSVGSFVARMTPQSIKPRPSPLRVALALDRRPPHSTKLEADSVPPRSTGSCDHPPWGRPRLACPRCRIQPDSFGHRLTCRKMSRGSDCSSRPPTAGCREH